MSVSRTPAVLAALALAGAAGFGVAHAASSGSLKSANVQLSDLPKGFSQAASKGQTAAQADTSAHLAKGTYAAHGYLSAWENDFQRNAKAGWLLASSQVAQFRSAAGAHWSTLEDRKLAASETHMSMVSMSGSVGQDSAALHTTTSANGVPVTLYAVTWRHGNYSLDLAVGGKTGSVSLAQAMSLAHKMDSRIH